MPLASLPIQIADRNRMTRRMVNYQFDASDQTRGHGTHSWPVLWPEHLAALLRDSQPRATPVPSPAT